MPACTSGLKDVHISHFRTQEIKLFFKVSPLNDEIDRSIFIFRDREFNTTMPW